VNNPDFLVIGAGIIGTSIALTLKREFGDSSVILIEKEKECASHASGRNSGILHAGFYYTADSLKARFTRDGNRILREYCREKNISVNACGKLVVTKDETELDALEELLRRGRLNKVELEEITEDEARSIEPRVRTHEKALFSPTTCSVNPLEVVKSLEQDAMELGVDVRYATRYISRSGTGIVTSEGSYEAGYIVNTAGLYADRIAGDFGFSKTYRILPFKGLYLYSDEPPGSIHTNIYPVPNLKNPFLGVHFTVTADGKTKIGPTAIPAFWREHYCGFSNFSWSEFVDIVKRELNLMVFSDFDFKKLAWEELRKYSRRRMVELAGLLASGVKDHDYTKWGRPGIRAQLVNIKDRKLEMDFVLEGDNRSMHVLNAVSPGFTCCIPFARYVCGEIQKLIN